MTTSLYQIILLYMVVALLPTLTLEVDIQISLLRDGGENAVTFRRTSNAKPTIISQSKDNGNDNDNDNKFVSVSRLNALVTQRLSTKDDDDDDDDDTTNRADDERENESSRMESLPHAQAQMHEENWSGGGAVPDIHSSLPPPPPPSLSLPLPPPPPPPMPFAIATFNRPTIEKNSKNIQTEPACGGLLKSRYGIIQTPNFPKQFPIPIECVWVIDASELVVVTDNGAIPTTTTTTTTTTNSSTSNVSIIVYLTQLYVLGGLKFTEYMYYSDDYKVPSHRVFQLTEDDVTQIAWIQFNSQYLEIKFQMNTLDGTQLRALDRLLDVYGFNITYEVDTVKSYQCNALQCRFLGHCYARRQYTGYYCSCFAGFSGSDCGHGPLCEDPHTNFCQNGGTCKHIGDAAVTCHCPAGFKGNKCEIPEIGEITMGCTENSSSSDCYKECDFGSAQGFSPTTKNKKNFGRNGKTRFEVTIRLGSNLTNFYRTTTENERKTSDHLPGLLERHVSSRNFCLLY